MFDTFHHSLVTVALGVLLELAVFARILLRPHRDPSSRIAWMVVVGVLPVLGIIAYLFLGEVNLGRRRLKRLHAVLERMPPFPTSIVDTVDPMGEIPERYRHLFELGRSISAFNPIGGNSAQLLPGSDAAIEALVADIDAAKEHVHVLFYIWLSDGNGCKVVEALKRAAARGVTLSCHGRCPGLTPDDSRTAMERNARRWRARRRRAADYQSTLASIPGPHRPAQPPQDRRHR
jgi:cardiolipin synthase